MWLLGLGPEWHWQRWSSGQRWVCSGELYHLFLVLDEVNELLNEHLLVMMPLCMWRPSGVLSRPCTWSTEPWRRSLSLHSYLLPSSLRPRGRKAWAQWRPLCLDSQPVLHLQKTRCAPPPPTAAWTPSTAQAVCHPNTHSSLDRYIWASSMIFFLFFLFTKRENTASHVVFSLRDSTHWTGSSRHQTAVAMMTSSWRQMRTWMVSWVDMKWKTSSCSLDLLRMSLPIYGRR